jgi:predicted nucleic acid-binding protein
MLVDTSGLLCFLHRDEPEHPRAVQILTNIATEKTVRTSFFVGFRYAQPNLQLK